MMQGHLTRPQHKVNRRTFVNIFDGLPAGKNIIFSERIPMTQDTVLVASRNNLDAPQFCITWSQSKPWCHKSMRFNSHVSTILMPADKTRTSRLFEKKHTAV
jgi:hypothetical protein